MSKTSVTIATIDMDFYKFLSTLKNNGGLNKKTKNSRQFQEGEFKIMSPT